MIFEHHSILIMEARVQNVSNHHNCSRSVAGIGWLLTTCTVSICFNPILLGVDPIAGIHCDLHQRDANSWASHDSYAISQKQTGDRRPDPIFNPFEPSMWLLIKIPSPMTILRQKTRFSTNVRRFNSSFIFCQNLLCSGVS